MAGSTLELKARDDEVALQGLSALTPIVAVRPYLLVNRLSAWHDLFQTPIAGDAWRTLGFLEGRKTGSP